jgi:hypothetical protein
MFEPRDGSTSFRDKVPFRLQFLSYVLSIWHGAELICNFDAVILFVLLLLL